jgi:hypothetical protein
METKCKRFCSDKICAMLFGLGFLTGHCITGHGHVSMYCVVIGMISIGAFYLSTKITEKLFLKRF